MKKPAFLLLALLSPLLSRADVIDRINECERQGGGACVFDLLREIANQRGGGGRERGVIQSGVYKHSGGAEATFTSLGENSFSATGFGNSAWNGTFLCENKICRQTDDRNRYFTVVDRRLLKESNGDLWTFLR